MFTYPMLRNQTSRGPLADLRREMDRLFDDFWSVPTNRSWSTTEREWNPACEVEESNDHYLLSLEMPGIPRDQIKLEVVDNQIMISGERHAESKKKETDQWYTERHYGKFQRTFTLPAGVDATKVEANYQDGILRVYVPKAESAKPRQIKIANGSGTGFFGKLIGQSSAKEKEERHSSSDYQKEKVAS